MNYTQIYSVPVNTLLVIERGMFDGEILSDIQIGNSLVTLKGMEAYYSEKGRSANYNFFTIKAEDKPTLRTSIRQLEKIARKGAPITCAAKIDVLGQEYLKIDDN
jgi:hypothetical protein